MTPITAGAVAPDFTLDGTQGKFTLSDWKGKKDVVLFFFPLAFTPT